MDCIVYGVAKSKTGLSDFHFATGYIFVWASLGPQLVKNPPIMQETPARSLGWEDWRRERLPTPVFWPGEFHGLYSPWGRRVRHNSATFTLMGTEFSLG